MIFKNWKSKKSLIFNFKAYYRINIFVKPKKSWIFDLKKFSKPTTAQKIIFIAELKNSLRFLSIKLVSRRK